MTLFWTKKSQHESERQAAALAGYTGECGMSVASKRQQRSKFIKPSSLLHFCTAAKRGFSTEDTSRSWSLSIRDTCAKSYVSNGKTWFRTLRFWGEHGLPALKRFSSKLSLDGQVTSFVWRMGTYQKTSSMSWALLKEGSRHVGVQRKRFKDTLKRSLTVCNIDIDKWESTAQDRMQWRRSVQGAVNAFENERIATAKEKRIKRKAIPSQQPSAPATFNLTCTVCGRVCTARIGLQSHMRTHK